MPKPVERDTDIIQVTLPVAWISELDKLRKFQSRSSYVKTIIYEYLLKIGRVEPEY